MTNVTLTSKATEKSIKNKSIKNRRWQMAKKTNDTQP